MLLNPSTTPAEVTVTCYYQAGVPPQQTVTIPARRRLTLSWTGRSPQLPHLRLTITGAEVLPVPIGAKVIGSCEFRRDPGRTLEGALAAIPATLQAERSRRTAAP